MFLTKLVDEFIVKLRLYMIDRLEHASNGLKKNLEATWKFSQRSRLYLSNASSPTQQEIID